MCAILESTKSFNATMDLVFKSETFQLKYNFVAKHIEGNIMCYCYNYFGRKTLDNMGFIFFNYNFPATTTKKANPKKESEYKNFRSKTFSLSWLNYHVLI